MAKNLRIFIGTSGLSALYQSIYAKNTRTTDDRDLFIVDALALKPSQKEPILQAIQHHHFDWVLDMSLALEEAATQVPGFRKRLTRKLKTLPVFKQVYDALYRRQEATQSTRLLERLLAKNPDPFHATYQSVKLHTQPIVQLNPSVLRKYPEAEIRYFEHGLGDYLDVEAKIQPGVKFHCIFDQELRAHRQKNGKAFEFIQPVVGEMGFLQEGLNFEAYFPKINEIKIPSEKPIVLLATQALRQFEVGDAFWLKFLDLCLEKVEEPEKYSFLIKPHPRQEKDVLERISAHLEKKGLEVILWQNPELKSLHLELIFRKMHQQVAFVFSPFSSAVFYLARLYPGQQTRYYYGIKALFEFTANTPAMYVRRWRELEPLLEDVFGTRAEQLRQG